jgi:hypothetical protein
MPHIVTIIHVVIGFIVVLMRSFVKMSSEGKLSSAEVQKAALSMNCQVPEDDIKLSCAKRDPSPAEDSTIMTKRQH